jgi:hypothetical protein
VLPGPAFAPAGVPPAPAPEPERPSSLPEPFPMSVVREPDPEPQPLHVPEPQPAPVVAAVPEPPPLPVAGYVVRGRLVNGEEIEIAAHTDLDEAQRVARDAMRACARADGADWPILSGRYVRPEAIVSIEVAEQPA